MLFLESIFRFDFGVTIVDDIQQAINDLLYFITSKPGADPDDESSYFRHKLVSLYVE